MQEDISGPAGNFRIRASHRGMGMVHRIWFDDIGTECLDCVCIVASATAAIRFGETFAATGSETQAWKSAGY